MSFLLVFLSALHLLLWIVLLANWRYLQKHARFKPAGDAWPFVSVLVPARNEAANLSRLLPSLLGQDYPKLELIVYDDASEDATPVILRRYSSDPRLRVLRGEGVPPGWVGKVHALTRLHVRHAERSTCFWTPIPNCCVRMHCDALLLATGHCQQARWLQHFLKCVGVASFSLA